MLWWNWRGQIFFKKKNWSGQIVQITYQCKSKQIADRCGSANIVQETMLTWWWGSSLCLCTVENLQQEPTADKDDHFCRWKEKLELSPWKIVFRQIRFQIFFACIICISGRPKRRNLSFRYHIHWTVARRRFCDRCWHIQFPYCSGKSKGMTHSLIEVGQFCSKHDIYWNHLRNGIVFFLEHKKWNCVHGLFKILHHTTL